MPVLIALAALSGGLAVALGAYGAHAINADADTLRIWRTGVEYQMWHALGGVAAAWVASIRQGWAAKLALAAGAAFLVGTALFSGTLYAFVLMGDVPVLGAAPFGGFMLMAGWLAIAVAALKRP